MTAANSIPIYDDTDARWLASSEVRESSEVRNQQAADASADALQKIAAYQVAVLEIHDVLDVADVTANNFREMQAAIRLALKMVKIAAGMEMAE